MGIIDLYFLGFGVWEFGAFICRLDLRRERKVLC